MFTKTHWMINIGGKFLINSPDYNDPSSEDCDKAVEYIYTNMKKKYSDENWDKIEKNVKDKIHAGIT